jgi:predicted nucleic acid-binding protein
VHVVDASVWVGRFLPADVHHQASRAWLGAQVDLGEILVAPALLLPELAGAVARRTGLSELATRVVALIEGLPNVRLVPVDPALAQLSATLAARLHLRGADAVYVALAHRLSVSLLTWDQEQLERAGPQVMVLTPAEDPGS